MSAVLLKNQLSNGLLQVRIAWGANLSADPATWTWSDVTTDVVQASGSGVTISPMGRSNQTNVAQPAGCTMRLKNQTGAYTPANPVASNYPNVRLGTPVQVRVSLNGGSTWSVRFQGEAASWTPGWDVQGKFAYVVLAASAKTRRLGSGTKLLDAAIQRTAVAASPAQNVPMTDGALSTQLASGIKGVAPIPVLPGNPLGTALSPPDFAGGPLAPWLPQAVSFANGGALVFPVPATVGATQWAVDHVVNLGTDRGTNPGPWSLLYVDANPTFPSLNWSIDVQPAGVSSPVHDQVNLLYYVVTDPNTSSATVLTTQDHGMWDGLPHHLRLAVAQSGSNINWSLFIDGQQFSGTINSQTLQAPTGLEFNPQEQKTPAWLAGQATVWNTATPSVSAATAYLATMGYAGETADARVTRLCAEEGIPLTVVGAPSNMTMGPQGIDTLLNLLRECEAADLGYLLDGLGPGLTYICRSSIYNEAAQMTINANSGQILATPGPQPTHDDQRLLNRVTVTRTNGSFAVVEDANGPLGTANVGVFDNRSVVNSQSDAPLKDVASWLVHLGTVEGMRYPQFDLDLAGNPELAPSWVGMIPTDRVDITNLGSQLTQHPAGTVSLLAEGWTEFLSATAWKVTVSCSAFRPWEVFQIQDARLGRIETDGSTLNSSASSGTTSLSVLCSGGLWDVSSTPFDAEVEGEQITVTAVTTALNSNPYFEGGVGNWTANGCSIAQDLTVAHERSGSLKLTPNGVAVTPNAECDQVAVTAGNTYQASGWLYSPGGYAGGAGVQVNWYNSGHVYISTSAATVGAMPAGLWMRCNNLFSAPATAAFAGVQVAEFGTPPAGAILNADEVVLAVPNVQTLTVTRSVNGVVKAHNSGATVKLWKPGVIAL